MWREFWSVFPQSVWTECDEIKENMNLKVIQLMKSVDVAKFMSVPKCFVHQTDFKTDFNLVFHKLRP